MSVIEVSKLTKYYGKARGIVDVSFDVQEGEIFGFIGPNGAGKSTTIRLLLSLYGPLIQQALADWGEQRLYLALDTSLLWINTASFVFRWSFAAAQYPLFGKYWPMAAVLSATQPTKNCWTRWLCCYRLGARWYFWLIAASQIPI
jgi:ABC-type phosphate/phosphonate transport system ATPase subunit